MVLGGADGDGPDTESQGEDDYEAAKSDGAAAVMKALKAGDSEAFGTALQDFVKLCME